MVERVQRACKHTWGVILLLSILRGFEGALGGGDAARGAPGWQLRGPLRESTLGRLLGRALRRALGLGSARGALPVLAPRAATACLATPLQNTGTQPLSSSSINLQNLYSPAASLRRL